MDEERERRQRPRRRDPLRILRRPEEPEARVVDVVDVIDTVDVRGPSPAVDLTEVPPRRRILLVDDEPDVRGWLRIALEPLRWDVNGARNVAEAIEMACRLEPDVVLLDQQLPDGKGLEVGRWLRAHRPAIELVMFSAHLDLAAEEEAERLGIVTVSKVDHAALFTTLAAVRANLDERRARR